MAVVQEGSALRPLGVGDIVDRVFGMYRQRPLMFIAIAAIPYLLLVLLIGALTVTFAAGALAALAPYLGGNIDPDRLDPARLLPLLGPLVAFVAVVAVAAVGVSLVQSAALIAAMSARYMGRETTIREALRAGLRRSAALLGMGLLALLAFVALWVVLVAVMVMVREWWALVAGVLAGAVATFYLANSWMVSPAVVTLEGAGPIQGLRRSWQLSQGNRWRIFGLWLLLLVLQVVLSSLLSFVLLASLAADEVVRAILNQAVNLVATVAWAPAYWGTFAVLYYDLRVRREAFDLQLAAESLRRA